jgi:hypothetical protein
VSNVVPIGIERSRRAHPSMQDRRVEDVGPPEQLALWQRQLYARTLRRWKTEPPSDRELEDMATLLLGES